MTGNSRKAHLAAALRENLKRRKDQARARHALDKGPAKEQNPAALNVTPHIAPALPEIQNSEQIKASSKPLITS